MFTWRGLMKGISPYYYNNILKLIKDKKIEKGIEIK